MKKAIRNIVIAIALIAIGIYFIPEFSPMTESDWADKEMELEQNSKAIQQALEEESYKTPLTIIAKEFYEVIILEYGITLLSFSVLIIWILVSLYKMLKDRTGKFLPITILILIVLYLITVFSGSSDCEYRTLKDSNGKETRYKICDEARKNLEY